jgi:hypothetical protein
VAIIIGGGFFYLVRQKNAIEEEYFKNLSAVSSLKINQITAWKKERFNDVMAISFSPVFDEKAGARRKKAG